MIMNAFAVPPLIVGVIVLFVGLLVFLKKKDARVNIIFSLFCLSVSLWLFGFSMMYFSKADSVVALRWARIGFVGIIFIPILAYHFISAFIGNSSRHIVLIYLLSLPCLYLNSFTDTIYKAVAMHPWGYYPVAGSLYSIFLIEFIFLISYVVVITFLYLRKPDIPIINKYQVRYLFLAFSIGPIAIVDYLAKYPSVQIYPFGYICTLVFISLIAIAIIKYKLMDIKIVFTKAGLFLFIYTLVLGIPFYVYSVNPGYFSIILMFIFATLGPLGYRYLNRKAEMILMAEQKRYQKILIQASEGMSKIHDLNKLLKFTVYSIVRFVKVQYAVAFLVNQEKTSYRLMAIRHKGIRYEPMVFDVNSSFIQYMQKPTIPFIYQELPESTQQSIKYSLDMQVIIPFYSQDKLAGFLLLGNKLNKKLYTADDINVFTILARQIALAIENCLFLEESRQAQERIFAAEKLASIGGMAEGIAHQLINRLNQFAVNSEIIELKTGKLLEKHADEENIPVPAIKKVFDDLNRVANSQGESVKRTYDMLKGILNYSTIEVKEQDFTVFTLQDILGPVLELLKVKHTVNSFPIVVKMESGNGQMYGVKAQLMEALYNILDNAYEALKEKENLARVTGEDYTPEIVLKMSMKESCRIIEVVDNGIGIKEENKAKIFAPFYSTKSTSKSGSGIGMYIVRRMVEEVHKGKTSIESEYGKGTVVRFELPFMPPAR